ncbi:MAG: hypothetical protein RL329_1374 [Bacteroidota bacterium]
MFLEVALYPCKDKSLVCFKENSLALPNFRWKLGN